LDLIHEYVVDRELRNVPHSLDYGVLEEASYSYFRFGRCSRLVPSSHARARRSTAVELLIAHPVQGHDFAQIMSMIDVGCG
jgi:hypothetical protein